MLYLYFKQKKKVWFYFTI